MGQLATGEMQTVSRYQRLMASRDFAAALSAANELLASTQDNALYWSMRGQAYQRMGQHLPAINDLAQANSLRPDSADFLAQFGEALMSAGELDGGESCFLRALQLDANHLDALLGLGSLYERQGRAPDASPHILKAVQCHPKSAKACHAAGRFLHFFGDRGDAAQFFAEAIKNDPQLPEPYYILANYLREADDMVSAVTMYNELLAQRPDAAIGEAERAHCMAHMNDWDNPGYRDFAHASPAQMAAGASPFLYLPLDDDPARSLQRAKAYGSKLVKGITEKPIDAPSNDRIRIGYFSGDFHDHATMHLLAGVLEAHDREKFEIFAYSYGPNRQDHMRARAAMAVDRFVDLVAMDDASAVALAREHQLDIAIDLKGFTAGTRIKLFAHRVAPVQVSWLGYPGTTGAPFMDVMIADDVTIPPGDEENFSERIVRLPGCYQPNDGSRPLPDDTLTRSAVGLPENGIVFASFNASYKISPTEFDVWMELLRAVDGSVLWQLDCGKVSQENLRKAAAARDVDPDRLIFAPRLLQGPHLARLALADIFLDTFNCNAHTTASDALWAGVPVVTRAGSQFAARVAASLCHAAGTPETVAETTDGYKAKALELARDPEKLLDLRLRLETQRDTCALFDTETFTRNFEEALLGLRAPR